jgi:hypothetical protein
LARESTADNVSGNPICGEAFAGKRFNVIVDRHSRPMLSQHALAERVDLAERYRAETTRALQAEVETSHASEQGKGAKRRHAARS